LKSTGHHNTETESEEVEEEPMTTTKGQEQQQWAMKKAKRKSSISNFLVPYCSLSGNMRQRRRSSRPANSSPLFVY
jgi:hypothetical protein